MDGTSTDSRTSDDIGTALAAMTTFQNYVQHADAKVSILLVAHAGAVVSVTASQTNLTTHLGVTIIAVFGMFAATLVISGYHLIQALRPRLHAPPGPSRFGITGVGSRRTTADVPAEAWEMARLFAEIARIKHTHVARAIPWTAATVIFGVGVTVVGGRL